MDKVSVTLRVFFGDPFWIGLVERISDEGLEVCKLIFGPEPKDYEVWQFVLEHYHKLKFGPPVRTESGDDISGGRRPGETHVNPKRMQRQAKRLMQKDGIGTKAQQALSLRREAFKRERKVRTRRQKEEERDRMYELRMQKRKEKHRGR